MARHSAEFAAIATGLLFAGSIVAQVPLTLISVRNPQLFIATTLVIWGAVAACTAAIKSAKQFYTMRFLLGCAEAGAFPSKPNPLFLGIAISLRVNHQGPRKFCTLRADKDDTNSPGVLSRHMVLPHFIWVHVQRRADGDMGLQSLCYCNQPGNACSTTHLYVHGSTTQGDACPWCTGIHNLCA